MTMWGKSKQEMAEISNRQMPADPDAARRAVSRMAAAVERAEIAAAERRAFRFWMTLIVLVLAIAAISLLV